MAISYKTGGSSGGDQLQHRIEFPPALDIPAATAFTGTLPSGILAGDVMIAGIICLTYSGGSPAFSTPTSGGGSWTQIGTIATCPQGSLVCYNTCWIRVATASDASSTFSISFTGTNGSTNAYY